MTKLTETQTLILSRASGQADRIALPLPDRLRGGAANKVIVPLIKRGLLDEVEADIRKGEPTWRKTGDGHGTTLVITDAGLEAIGVETVAPEPERVKPKPRTGTKQAMLIGMLEAPDGATIAEIAKATNWLPHTIRGAMSGALKKRMGLTITSEKVEGRGRTYKIASRSIPFIAAAAPLGRRFLVYPCEP